MSNLMGIIENWYKKELTLEMLLCLRCFDNHLVYYGLLIVIIAFLGQIKKNYAVFLDTE